MSYISNNINNRYGYNTLLNKSVSIPSNKNKATIDSAGPIVL